MNRSQTCNNIKRKALMILGLWVGVFIVNEAQAQQLENSLLWKVEGDSIQTSYLFGTFHLLPQADFELKQKVTQAFDGAEQIVMELDMDDPGMQTELLKNAFMQNGQTLDQLLTKEEFETLDAYMQKVTGVGLSQVNNFKPFFVSTMVIPGLIEGTPASYEMSFVQRAMNRSKEIYGLETPAEQVKFFDNIPYHIQAKELVKVATEQKEMTSLFKDMIKNYKKENVTTLYDLAAENMSDMEQVKSLLTDRNANWIPKIRMFSKDKITFYAVGAGHLGGDLGLINLLRDAGYTVSPVMN